MITRVLFFESQKIQCYSILIIIRMLFKDIILINYHLCLLLTKILLFNTVGLLLYWIVNLAISAYNFLMTKCYLVNSHQMAGVISWILLSCRIYCSSYYIILSEQAHYHSATYVQFTLSFCNPLLVNLLCSSSKDAPKINYFSGIRCPHDNNNNHVMLQL